MRLGAKVGLSDARENSMDVKEIPKGVTGKGVKMSSGCDSESTALKRNAMGQGGWRSGSDSGG